MLGDIARWLRLLGYDTLYSKDYNDWEILKIAEKEGRTIITRDLSLYRKARKKKIPAIYLEPEDIGEELAYIASRTGIRLVFKPNKTRCPYCNTELMAIPKAEAMALVPPAVGTKYERFWKCPKCKRVYWQGNHWNTIDKVLESARHKLDRMVKRSGS